MKPLLITLSLLITAALFAEDKDIVERKYAPKLKAAKKAYDGEVTSIKKRMQKAYLSLRDRAMRDKDLDEANEWNKKAEAVKNEGLEGASGGITKDELIGKSFLWYGTAHQWKTKQNICLFNAGGTAKAPWAMKWKIEDGKLWVEHLGKYRGYFYRVDEGDGLLTFVCTNWANLGTPHVMKEIASDKK